MDIRIYIALEDALIGYEKALTCCNDKDDEYAKGLKDEIDFLKQFLKDNPMISDDDEDDE